MLLDAQVSKLVNPLKQMSLIKMLDLDLINELKHKPMKPTRFQKELQRELDRLESIVLTEELKESLARERKEIAKKQIENLKASNGAYASL